MRDKSLIALVRGELTEKILEKLTQNPCLVLKEKEFIDDYLSDEFVAERIRELLFSYEDFDIFAYSGTRDVIYKENEEEWTKPLTFWQRVTHQIELNFENKEKEIAYKILDNLDENGFLKKENLKKISEDLNIPVEEVENIRKKMMNFDPLGVASFDWQEYKKFLKEKLKRDILNLQPPAKIYSQADIVYITPDIFIRPVKEKDKFYYRVELYEPEVPFVHLNIEYLLMIDDKNIDTETKKYLKENMEDAIRFLKDLSERREILLAIGKEIVQKFEKFIIGWEDKINPLPLDYLSQKFKIDKNILKLAVENHFVDTPRGIYPLKFFFKD